MKSVVSNNICDMEIPTEAESELREVVNSYNFAKKQRTQLINKLHSIFSIVRDHRFQPKNDHRFQPVQMSSNSTNIQNAVDSIFVSLSYLRQYGSVAEVHLSDYLVLSSVRLACKVEAIGSVEKTVQYALRKN